MRRTVLPNGIRVLSENLPDLRSVTVGIWVENGSRYEPAGEAGISHFLEHLFFKGTARRTAAEIAEAIDAVGGVLNAFTGKEHTCYYAKVLQEHLPLALDVLGDIFTSSTFPEDEIDRERSVIIQEISQVEDTPDDYVHDLFALRFWPNHPLGRPIAGSADTVGGLHREHFLRFLDARYRPDRVVVVAAGRLDHEELVATVARALGHLDGRVAPTDDRPPETRVGVDVHEKPLEQMHVCLGVPAISQAHPDRYTVHLLNLALGGGMSSRLFQEIREKRGRCYSVYSFLSSYRDTGYLGIYAGTSAEWLTEVIDVARAEVGRLAREGLGVDELARSKTQMKGNMLLALETSDSRMSRLAKNELYHGRDVGMEEVAASIDAVSPEDVVRVAHDLFAGKPLATLVLGDLKGATLPARVVA
jgi:predicted Zn-dependent peptidase